MTSDVPAREHGGGDHDQPYRFGRKPTSNWTYPFTAREFIKLLILKARLRSSAADLDSPANVAAVEAPLD